MTHICVSKLTIIGSDNGLSPGRRQAINWTNTGILLIRPLGTNFNEMLIEILTFSFMKTRLKVSSAKWRPFCLDLNMLKVFPNYVCPDKLHALTFDDHLALNMTKTSKGPIMTQMVFRINVGSTLQSLIFFWHFPTAVCVLCLILRLEYCRQKHDQTDIHTEHRLNISKIQLMPQLKEIALHLPCSN